MKLFEIKESYLRLMEMDLDEQTMRDTLEGLEGDLEDKIDNIACIIKSLEAEKKAISEEVEKMMIRITQKQVKADNLKEYVYQTFKALNKDKIETKRNVLQIKKNPASVVLVEGFNIEEYMTKKITVAPDKTKIKELLKQGTEIPGARLEQKERLEIK